jgi:hypothetical protein
LSFTVLLQADMPASIPGGGSGPAAGPLREAACHFVFNWLGDFSTISGLP